MGSANRSAIGTLVERTTRYLVLLHLPDGHGAEHVRDALVDAVSVLPARLRRSLTWDQGVEMGRHDEFALASDRVQAEWLLVSAVHNLGKLFTSGRADRVLPGRAIGSGRALGEAFG